MIRNLSKPRSIQLLSRTLKSQAYSGRGQGTKAYGEESPIRKEKCINAVQLLGRVGQDPRVGGSSSKKVVQFSVATSIYYQSQDDRSYGSQGNLQSKTHWHNIAVFRPYLQDKVEAYVKKGSRVLVNGSLDYSTYIDENGVQKTNVSVIPDDIIILATPGRENMEY